MRVGQRALGLLFAGLGLVYTVLAVLLFGLTTDGGAIDWVSVITAAAGIGLVATGLYLALRLGGADGARSRPVHHPSS